MYKVYVAEFGDTVDTISNKFNIDKDTLNKINGQIVKIFPGLPIIVPCNKEKPLFKYVVKKGDTVYNIANENRVNYKDLLLIIGLNEEDYIYPG